MLDLVSQILAVAFFIITMAGCSRAPAVSAKSEPAPLEYVGEWGTLGSAPGEFADPTCITTDRVGNVFIADRSSRFITKTDPQGHPLLSFRTGLAQPSAIAVDRGGAIYVADAAANVVAIFLPDGRPFRRLRGSLRARFRWPSGVGVDAGGTIFVSEAKGNRVRALTPRGRLIQAWGSRGKNAGQFDRPGPLAVGPDGLVYVVDAGNRRVEVFSRDGSFRNSWDLPVSGHASACISAIAVSSQYVFLADCAEHAVQVGTLAGQWKFADALGGRISAQDATPAGLALSLSNDLLVLDQTRGRVLRFRINF